ncbi:hypothetical protein, partial [Anabaena sp. CCY 9910]|uniref:hypothetical protein n=1 Tax=Anabaena sp. CCY 9910 TaxID=3103870 RepID=UPI0039DFED32
MEMLSNAIERNLFELYGLFCAGVGVPEKPVCGEFEGDKKISAKKMEKELTRKSRLDILDKCLREGR